MLDDAAFITVTDLKQFAYCQRVLYYERCLPHIRPRTYKMEAGREAHEEEPKRAIRRSLSGYDLPDGERFFNVHLTSPALGLNGMLDEMVVAASGEYFPVDYKLAKRASPGYRLQLTAYALLIEANYGVVVKRGYLYLIPTRKLVKIDISDELRQQIDQMLTRIREITARETMPEATPNRNSCAACEFRRFCNDV